jgi:uncharacterized membrane-anchored protein
MPVRHSHGVGLNRRQPGEKVVNRRPGVNRRVHGQRMGRHTGMIETDDTARHSGTWSLFEPHPLRQTILGEVHARPFHPVDTPRRLFQMGFVTGTAASAADRHALGEMCRRQGVEPPQDGAKHHRFSFTDGATLRWEQHSEFTTYTFDIPAHGDRRPFERSAREMLALVPAFERPGPLLVAADLHLMREEAVDGLADHFDPASLAASHVDGQAALIASDFRPCPDGFVRILVLDRSLDPAGAGALCQRVLEIETYRILALLGLPEAQRLAPAMRRIEEDLTRIAAAMTTSQELNSDQRLLDEMTVLAAALEADWATSAYRFGASRAYDGIVQQRLAVIGESRYGAWPTFGTFLARRMAPAMRTCQMLEERQANLSRKLTRAANLLRTRVDVAIEQQNRDVLSAMNERTGLQLRLQQTVEGLSVAAISYYVVGLVSYVAKGAKDAGLLPVDPGFVTAAAVPVSIMFVWLLVRRIRRGHSEGH